jgi:hypothetical protein
MDQKVSSHLFIDAGTDEAGNPILEAEYAGYDDNGTPEDESDDNHLYYIRRYKLREVPVPLDNDGDLFENEDWVDGVDNDGDGLVDEDPEDSQPLLGASEGYIRLYDPDLQMVQQWSIPSLLCIEHNIHDGLRTSAEGLQHTVLVKVPIALMDKAGEYRFVISAKDSHADREKGHRAKWALERNQRASFKLEEVRIVVSKQAYQENDPSTYPSDENIIVKADPSANPAYESLYMYAVVKATISRQGTFWFLGRHNVTAHNSFPKKARLGGQTVTLYRWKWSTLTFTWHYIDPDWAYHSNDSDGDNILDHFENPWTKITSAGSAEWQLFDDARVSGGSATLKLGARRYKVKVQSGPKFVRSPDETDTDTYGPKEEVRRVCSMYAFDTDYLRWCSTFLRINTIYASHQTQVERYIGGDCCDVAVAAYRKMGGTLGSATHDWSADSLAKTTNESQISTVNEPKAGDLVFFDIQDPADGTFDHTTIFAGNMSDPDNDPANTKVSPKDRMMNTNFGHTATVIPPSDYGEYAFIWATYEHFPSHYFRSANHRIRHLSGVTEHTHP